MKKSSALTLISILPFLLSSCSYNGSTPSINNGDLILESEITMSNCFRDMTYERMTSLIRSDEPYLFLLTQEGCSHCAEFKPIIASYIKETKELVYYLDYATNYSVFLQIFNDYGELFFINGEVSTPSLFIAQGVQFSNELPYNRFSNQTMFTNLMKENVYTTDVYSITRVDALHEHLKTNESTVVFFYDRNTDARNTYHNQVEEIALASPNKTIIVETSFMDEENRSSLYSEYDISDGFVPFAVHYQNDVQDSKYIFTSNEEDGKAYLKQYL